MISMSVLKGWITDTLSADTAFTAQCVASVGSALNFYRGTPMNKVVEVVPFFTAYTDESNKDFYNGGDFSRQWNVPCALAIDSQDITEMPVAPITVGVTTVYELTDKAELLADAAVEVLRLKAMNCGINGENVILLSARIVVSQIGEADDVQANIFLVFGLENHV